MSEDKRTLKKLSIVEALQKMEGGTVEELRRAIDKVTQAIDEASKGSSGSVTLKINFKKLGKGQVEVTDSITETTPKIQRDSTIFFVFPGGGLTTSNPLQSALDGLNEEEEAKR